MEENVQADASTKSAARNENNLSLITSKKGPKQQISGNSTGPQWTDLTGLLLLWCGLQGGRGDFYVLADKTHMKQNVLSLRCLMKFIPTLCGIEHV